MRDLYHFDKDAKLTRYDDSRATARNSNSVRRMEMEDYRIADEVNK